MVELGQLESQHQEIEKRKVRVIVASLEGTATAQETQAQLPHLLVIADAPPVVKLGYWEAGLGDAFGVIHRDSNPQGGDTTAPTTFLIDGAGRVRWTFRAERFFTRLTPAQLLTAIDEHMP